MQHGKGGGISIYGGTHPYGLGGNSLGGMFRSLFRSPTPFFKTTAKEVGKRMLDTGLETGMQLLQDVINGQPLKKAAKPRAKAAGKHLLTGVINAITQQARGKRVYKRADTSKSRSLGQTKKRRTPRSTLKTIFDFDLTGGKKIDGYNSLLSGSGDMNRGHGIDIDRVD